ncbi:MAG: mechanosensitive ion channel domain-containing protein [Cyanobacteria bacterium P01_A01_bin.68]
MVEQIFDFLLREDIRNIEIFILCVVASLFIGRYTPVLIQAGIKRFLPSQVADVYKKLIYTNSQPLKWAGSSLLILLSLTLISEYKVFYEFLGHIVEFAAILSISIFASGVFRQLVRTYGIALIRKLGYQADDLLLIAETIVNIIIGFLAIFVFANNRFNLVGLITGLGIGGVAIAFGAQKTLEQLLGTIVIYLDRPFVTGDYIHFPPSGKFTEGTYGRVESIGFRSTKIRSSGRSTLVVVPNSILANAEIENVTRGKKVMVLLYLDFNQKLLDKGQALVRRVVEESMESLFGVEPDTAKVVFEDFDENKDIVVSDNSKAENSANISSSTTVLAIDKDSQPERTRARITFFLLGSNQNSLELRKQLVDLANEKVSHQLNNFGIQFVMQEPNIYIEAPVTI